MLATGLLDERAGALGLTYGLLPSAIDTTNTSSTPSSSTSKKKKKTAAPPSAEEPQLKGHELLGSCNLVDSSEGHKYYITTAINYANGSPHIGHAYEALLTDAVARYYRLSGRRVKFVTGADEHGQKIMNTASREGITPKALVDRCVAQFKDLDAALDVSYDEYVRTTCETHKEKCREIWLECAHDITLERYEGWYDERAEMFVKQSEAEMQNFCDADGVPLKRTTEECYFFALGKYASAIKQHIERHPNFVQPDARRQEVLKMLEVPLDKLAISRTTFDWGVSLPPNFDSRHVMYVWMDALTNYITGAEPGQWWPCDCHVIGKDIVRFHAIYWPAFLMSAGRPLPDSVFCHGFVLDAAGAKMSKTLGNVISPHDMLLKYDSDTFRFFCCKEAASPGADIKFSETALSLARNGELADGFGNLVHRATALVIANCGAKVPELEHKDVDAPFDVKKLYASCRESMAVVDVSNYARAVMAATRATNKWIADLKPWQSGADNTTTIFRVLLEACYVLALYLAPLVPRAATRAVLRVGGILPPPKSTEAITGFDNLRTGAAVTTGAPLFEQIALESTATEALKKEKKASSSSSSKRKVASSDSKEANHKDYGDADDTAASRLALVVGQIVEVWPHPESEKLFCEKIDLGTAWGGVREIGSGLRAHYKAEDLQDKLVLVAANLKPRKLAGFSSKGMVLCASSPDHAHVVCIRPPPNAKPGDRVILPGLDNPPSSEKVCDKQKLFVSAQPHFVVKEHTCFYKDKPFEIPGAGACTADVDDGYSIS